MRYFGGHKPTRSIRGFFPSNLASTSQIGAPNRGPNQSPGHSPRSPRWRVEKVVISWFLEPCVSSSVSWSDTQPGRPIHLGQLAEDEKTRDIEGVCWEPDKGRDRNKSWHQVEKFECQLHDYDLRLFQAETSIRQSICVPKLERGSGVVLLESVFWPTPPRISGYNEEDIQIQGCVQWLLSGVSENQDEMVVIQMESKLQSLSELQMTKRCGEVWS